MNQVSQPQNIFVYQAYGKVEILQQTLFSVVSLLSFLKNRDDFQLVIYTDRREYFEGFLSDCRQVHYELLSPERIQNWKGQIQFVHRLKIEMLLHAAGRWVGKLIYLDGDTYFLLNPMQLFQRIDEKNTLMHLPEGQVSVLKDPLSKKLKKFLKRESFIINGKSYKISPDVVMWNAGVIGVTTSQRPLLQQVLELTDQAYGKYQKHVMEQLAVSEVLQKNTTVHRTDDVIYHYWNQKDVYQERIVDFLGPAQRTASLGDQYTSFQFPPAPRPKPTFFEKLKMWLD